jgi:glycine cleavage system H protein
VIPEDLRYTSEHEWVRVTDSGTVVFGITDYAQDALGDIVFVDLPAPEATLDAGSTCGEVESTKSVSDIYAPISGVVVARNDALADTPEVINADPYGDGWLLEVRPDDVAGVQALLDAAAYSAMTEES